MNRTIKEATVRRFHYDHKNLRAHLATFLAAYNFGKRLIEPSRTHTLRTHLSALDRTASPIRLNPIHQMPGLNIQAA
jgi:hypothetical protein